MVVIGDNMMTKSFFDDLVLDTPEAVADMGRVLKRHEEEGGYKPYGKLKLCTDPGRIARFMAAGMDQQTFGLITVTLGNLLRDHSESDVAKRLSTFTCTDDRDGEWFLHNLAIPMEKDDVTRTYLAIDDLDRIIGFFTVGLRCVNAPEDITVSEELVTELNIVRETGRAQMYLIGRPACSDGSGPELRSSILSDAIDVIDRVRQIVGCRLIGPYCTDSLDDSYRENGFTRIGRDATDDRNFMVAFIG